MQPLNTKAMLVNLSVSRWTARKYDKKISDEVATMKHADKDSGRYHKVLGAWQELKEIDRVRTEARAFWWENTLPWCDDGKRILPSVNYAAFMKREREYHDQFEAAVKHLVTRYPELVKQAKTKLNGMFNEADYPSVHEIARRYGFSVDIEPIPVGADFRVGLAGEEVKRIAKEIEDRLKTTTAAAMKDLWVRLHDVVKRVAEKLADKDAIFRDTLLGNVVELTNLLPALNLTEDPELEKMRRLVESSLCNYEPQVLRDDEKVRKQAAKNAEDILKKMASYVGEAK